MGIKKRSPNGAKVFIFPTKTKKEIKRLRDEKDKRGKEVLQASAKYYHLLEEIKLKDNLISEFQKKNLETEAKLKQQETLYGSVRTDRNQKSKQLTETQEEIGELKRKYRIVMHTISQQKEDIDSKEQALTREYFKAKDLEKNCQS
jgi:chromosome segregation ATPase